MRAKPQPGDEDREHAWHARPAAEALAALGSRAEGLAAAEAEARLRLHGPNQLPRQPPPSILTILLRQFRSPLIYILAAAAVLALFLKEYSDAGFIAVVLALNAAIGGYEEWRAERSSRALEKMLRIRAAVLRDGEVCEIDAEGVVPGDVVWLESGQRVPADLRLLGAQGLEVDESLLTGESLPVLKEADWIGDLTTGLGDRLNMAHAGTTVARGRGRGLVVATGPRTVIGGLALDVMSATGGKPPLLVRLERFTRVVAVAVLVAAALVALAGLLRHYPAYDVFFFAVALAVSAIPEGLPVAVTVALAIATARMARRGVIVRQLAAVEGLGSCTYIASDKTGTLTCNELTARRLELPDGTRLEVTGEGVRPEGEVLLSGQPVEPGARPDLEELLRAAVLCNEADLHHHDGAWVTRGDPTDVALLTLARKGGWVRERSLAANPMLAEIPFEPERRFAATFHQTADGVRAFVKGAPERVLAMCAESETSQRLETLRERARGLAGEGYRVLAFATGAGESDLKPGTTPVEPRGLRFVGFVGMIDPLRPGAAEAVGACQRAGIRVAMVTGDHPVTALAIGRELGLAETPEQVILGRKLAEEDEEALPGLIDRARVFARVAPREKLRIVEAARRAGHFVAVTGDGVNDAPALRSANIGVAMGRSGTDVARDASDIVVSDDNFATIVQGVEQGRIAYDNIRKVIYLLVSTGAAEVLMVTLAVAAGLPLPLLPAQLLWLNLVTNGIQDVALAFEPGEGDELRRRPRRPRERIFNQLMIERTLVAAATMAAVGLGAFAWMLEHGWSEPSARNALLALMVLFENIHIGNCRSETKSALALSPLRSPILLSGAIGAFLIHVGSMHTTFGHRVLRTESLNLAAWGVLLALALIIFVVMEAHKWSWKLRAGRT